MKFLLNYSFTHFFTSGLLFVVVFLIHYSLTDNSLYANRDDAIITLSHAKNFVDYGFIGVNPSGPIVEGFSAPFQFWIYVIFYKLTKVEFKSFFLFQTIICTFLLGGFFTLFFNKSFKSKFLISFFSALSLTFIWKFFSWHGSGMENAYTHFLFLGTVYFLYNFFKKDKINFYFAIFVFFATISRVESVYHIAPILLIFSIFWFLSNLEKSNLQKLEGLLFSSFVFILWLSFHLGRFFYFGDFLPNTAYAQNISILDRINSFISFDISFIVSSLKNSFTIFFQLGIVFLIVPLFKSRKQAFTPPHDKFLENFKTFFILFKKKELYNQNNLLLLMCFSLIITALLAPFIFGPARMDVTRTSTHSSIFVLLLFSSFLYKKKINEIKFYILLSILVFPVTFFV